MKTNFSIYLICSLLLINIAGNGQIIDDYLANPISVRVLCGYKFNPLIPTNTFQNWIIPSPNAYLVNSSGAPDANLTVNPKYVKWKNVEASAYTDSCVLQVQYTDYLGVTKYITRTVGPFNLTFKTVTFAGGSIKNIPCYATTPVTIALDNYLNTDNNYPFDKNEWITRHFEWTLPSGWQTTAGQTGTFVGLSLIVVIPPVSNSSVNISVRAKANNQYSQPSTLQITRNLEDFSIGGDAAVTCYSTKRFTAPATPSGVTYSWQLPTGWTGVANSNYIDAIVTGMSGTVTCRMTGCGQFKESTKAVTVNKVEPGTGVLGPTIVCTAGSIFSISPTPLADSIIWSVGPNLSVYSGQNTNSPTIKATGSGSSWVSVRLVTNCGSITLPQKNVWAGIPNNSQIDMTVMFGQSPYNILCTNTEQIIAAGHTNAQQQGIDSYYWDFGSWASYHTGYDLGGITNSRPTFYLSGYPPTSQVIKVAAHNQCGHSMTYAKSKTFYAQNCFGYRLVFSPNPATDETTMTIETTSPEESVDQAVEWEMEVYDPAQNLKDKKIKIKGDSTKLQTSGWKEGIYIVRVKYKDEIITGKLAVKK
jgi:hypothetical protein